tara:strand:+ start:100 stop:711 length:612 start_codon:yes stop_codon:yes gene_type:complete
LVLGFANFLHIAKHTKEDNMKERWIKETKADGTTYYWTIRKNDTKNGWGCGYVALPSGHPWANQHLFAYSPDLANYDAITGEENKVKYIPFFDRELTAGFHLTHRDDAWQWAHDKKRGYSKDMEGYYVIGFYANHGEFDSMSDVISDTIKLMDDADLFYRDYNTIMDARKILQKKNLWLFDEDLSRKINELVEDKFGEGTKLL